MTFYQKLEEILKKLGSLGPGAKSSDKKNYTEKLSNKLSGLIAEEFRRLGLKKTKFPSRGRDKQFMGGYGKKGVDVYLSDEKHGLHLSSGTKGILFSVKKNLKNRYRDMTMEALELHKRFPYAVCGHFVFLSKSEAERTTQAFGTVLHEAVTLFSGISGRKHHNEAPELYEEMAILLVEPGDPSVIELHPQGVPPELQAGNYVERMVERFKQRNPFYF